MRSRKRHLFLAETLSLLVVFALGACSRDSPTGLEIDPLVGKWIGTFYSPVDNTCKEESFTLTVQCGGTATGTGYFWYHVEGGSVAECLFVEVEVGPDGSLSGEGRWILYVIGAQGIYGEGSVTGSLEVGTGRGSGKLTLYGEGGMLLIPWEVSKVVAP